MRGGGGGGGGKKKRTVFFSLSFKGSSSFLLFRLFYLDIFRQRFADAFFKFGIASVNKPKEK